MTKADIDETVALARGLTANERIYVSGSRMIFARVAVILAEQNQQLRERIEKLREEIQHFPSITRVTVHDQVTKALSIIADDDAEAAKEK